MENMKTVRGKYNVDQNFINLYSNDRLYTLALNGTWGSVKVGDLCSCWRYTKEQYNKESAECTKVGTFNLYNDGRWGRCDDYE